MESRNIIIFCIYNESRMEVSIGSTTLSMSECMGWHEKNDKYGGTDPYLYMEILNTNGEWVEQAAKEIDQYFCGLIKSEGMKLEDKSEFIDDNHRIVNMHPGDIYFDILKRCNEVILKEKRGVDGKILRIMERLCGYVE